MSLLSSDLIKVKAFSGLESNRNKCGSACLPSLGPIPPGLYYIVDRPTGGPLGKMLTLAERKLNWFALYAADGKVDDHTWCGQVERGLFRLHPKRGLGISEGCIVVDNTSDFSRVRTSILSKKPYKIKNTNLMAYAELLVKCEKA